MKKYIKKADVILLIILVIAGLASTVYVAASKSNGDTVIVEQYGNLYGKYSLFENKEIDVPAFDSISSDVHISIKDGSVKVTKSGCHNQICVRHAAISSTGESIICLPNRVVVEIEGKGGGYDAVTN